jgi:hypothetical protein
MQWGRPASTQLLLLSASDAAMDCCCCCWVCCALLIMWETMAHMSCTYTAHLAVHDRCTAQQVQYKAVHGGTKQVWCKTGARECVSEEMLYCLLQPQQQCQLSCIKQDSPS